ncbi:MAG: hypothetical protein DSY33_03860 [Archaeoglobus sp.]|nr:MAG: hypothetical protein DSY33_03860 [Archaeoglobus sp.]
MLISIAVLTVVFVSLYWILTHQTVYFGSVLVEVSPSNLIVVYIFLLAGILMRGKLRFLRPFFVAIALYMISDILLFNLQMYYPIMLNKFYLLMLLLSIAIVVSDLPKRHVTSCVGFVLAAISFYAISYQYNSFIATVLAAVLIYLALTSLAFGFEGVIARGISASRAYIVLALLAVAVIELAKPYLKGGLFDFTEWAFLALAAFLAFRKFKPEWDELYLEPHSQLITKRYDELIVNLDSAANNFVRYGDKAILVACISKALLDAGYNEKELAEAIYPVVNYCDITTPILSFPWEKVITEKRNVSRRKRVLKAILKNLGKNIEEVEL